MSDFDEMSLISLIFGIIAAIIMAIVKLCIWPQYNTFTVWFLIVIIPAIAVMVVVFIILIIIDFIDFFG